MSSDLQDMLDRVTDANARGLIKGVAAAALADALGGALARLQSCPECGADFVKYGRRLYCTAQCAERVRGRRFREKHPGRVRQWRREQYRKSQARLRAVGSA